ncbi:Centromere protein S [Taenia solium]|eukprot:TsM_000820800 transcript=TsM_000820800 gene=TsM_000820800
MNYLKGAESCVNDSLLNAPLEHLPALHCECIARAKVVSGQSGVRIPDEIASFVTENAFRFAQLLVTDLESFARHAKRSTINQDDVLLFARRNPQLLKFLDEKSTAFDVAADGEGNVEMQSVKRRIRQSVKNAKKSLKTPSSSKAPETMKISPQKTSERKDSPVPTVSTPIEDDRQQSGVGPSRVSLLDSDDEFSNIFDEVGDV